MNIFDTIKDAVERPRVPAGGKLTEHAASLREQPDAHVALQLSSLQAFYDQLSRFDWNYEYSDDPGVYRTCRDALDLLRRDSNLSDRHHELFLAFEQDGKHWCTPPHHWPENVQPKPIRP